MIRIHILADDLTGALDSVADLRACAPVHLGSAPAPTAGTSATRHQVEALSTGSRDILPAELPDRLQKVLGWFREADLCIKKVDSLLRGNTFEEVAWVARAGGFSQIVFAPAFPKLGRVTFDGHHWLATSHGTAPTQVDTPSLKARFAALGLEVIGERPGHGDALRVWIPDVRTEQDLQRLAALAQDSSTRNWLWCGSGGLANALLTQNAVAEQDQVWRARSDGPCTLVSSSFQESFKRQWRELKQALRTTPLCVESADANQMQQALARDVPTGTLSMFDLSPATRLTAEEAAAQRSTQISHLIHKLPKPGALFVIGGDTFLDIVRASGASTILAGALRAHRVGLCPFAGRVMGWRDLSFTLGSIR